MLQYVHHVNYVVHNRDAMVEYLEKNFGMKPDNLEDTRIGKEAQYNIGQTQIQITEPKDNKSGPGKHLEKHGPGVTHVAWGVENIRKTADELTAKGLKMRGENPEGTADGQVHKPGTASHDYRTVNIDLDSSLGVKIQLVGPN